MSDWSDWRMQSGSQRYPDPHEGYGDPHLAQGTYVVPPGGQHGQYGHDAQFSSPVTSVRQPVITENPQTSSAHAAVPVVAPKDNSSMRFAGFAVGYGSFFAEQLLSHPFIVLRRQCQVHHDARWYHTTPFTLPQVFFNISRHQSFTTMWKGIGSRMIVRSLTDVSENVVAEFLGFSKVITRYSSVRKWMEHIALKGFCMMLVTPLYAASLVESVQSEIASERPGTIDCLREGASRMLGWNASQTTRLLPIWQLAAPALLHGFLHYAITSLADYTVRMSVTQDIMDRRHLPRNAGEVAVQEKSLYEKYYPEMIARFTGQLLADALVYPLETVLHRMCLQGTRTIIDNTDSGLDVIPIITRYEGMVDCFKTIVAEEGIGGLYKGFGSLILQYLLHMGFLKLAKLAFDKISEHYSNPAADSAEEEWVNRSRSSSTPKRVSLDPRFIPGLPISPYDRSPDPRIDYRHMHGGRPM